MNIKILFSICAVLTHRVRAVLKGQLPPALLASAGFVAPWWPRVLVTARTAPSAFRLKDEFALFQGPSSNRTRAPASVLTLVFLPVRTGHHEIPR